MPHFPKPFFRPKKKRWCVELDGKHVNLRPDEHAAWVKYHESKAARARTAGFGDRCLKAILDVSKLVKLRSGLLRHGGGLF